jgi:type III restriction enzyme
MPRVADQQQFQLQDLVLNVKTSVDRNRWNEDRYAAFLDELCREREYQKQAILTALRYMLGGEYQNLEQLARENWDSNEVLRDRYGSWKNFYNHLQFPDNLSATLDLATGTGKSYVIYGIASILLAEGAVDRVLVLCPSTTIERGLLDKFHDLAKNADLRALLPATAKITTPRIIDASETIVEGTICVENRDAVYEHVRSSIRDSLWGNGARVAVLNDEAHHVANDPDARTKRWKEFLQNPEYGFNTILGFSGTCYVDNEYFSDVIFRYSIREAMEQKFVKVPRYVVGEVTTGEEDERWQLIYNRHEKIRSTLSKRDIRPLTIIVTANIRRCKLVGQELREFLVEQAGLSEEEALERVLVVYNNAPDVPKLRRVDDKDSQVEWIVSVSMLNEGWDVKRVFQIVPHEERAFNSKLLIAQVLGRGLRVPEDWKGEQPEVTVFNHAAWATSIQHLVNEVLENERRLTSRVVPDSPFHFELHTLSYEMETKSEDAKPRTSQFNILTGDIVDLPSEADTVGVSIDFERAIQGTRETWNTAVRRQVHTPEDVAWAMYDALRRLDMETASLPDPALHTHYVKDYPYERLLNIVKRSLKGDTMVSEKNKQRLLAAIGTARRPGSKRVRYDFSPKELLTISTKDRPADSVSAAMLRRGDKVLFYTEGTEENLSDEEVEFFEEVAEQDSDYKKWEVRNRYDFKTPLNLAIADAGTERNFMRELVRPTNTAKIDAWIKSTSMRFYSINYSWRKGDHPIRRDFNPDFFIKIGKLVLVIEIKDDTELRDPSIENIKKNESAVAHFIKLNARLKVEGIDVEYLFHFIAPADMTEFFQRIREGTIDEYRSNLDWRLSGAVVTTGE